jgi:hypothetical protein
MEQLAYSSITAFLAHYATLSSAATDRGGINRLPEREAEILIAMQHVMEALTPEERTVLMADAARDEKRAAGEERRRCERALLKLRRILLSKGIVRS